MTTKTKKGWCIFYDQIESIRDLPGNDFKSIVLALNDFSQNGTVPTLSGSNLAIANIMISQMKRQQSIATERAKAGQKGGCATASKFAKAKISKAKANSSYNNNNNNININKDNTPPISPKGEDKQFEQYFNEFWKEYPKKKDKQNALKVYLQIKPSAELQKTIIDALSKQKQSSEWQKEDGQFIPLPTKWLKGKRWEDETQTNIESKEQTKYKKQGVYV